MNRTLKKVLTLAGVLVLLLALTVPALASNAGNSPAEPAAETQTENSVSSKAIAAGIAVGIAAAAGAIAMGLATAKSTESIARQPEAEGKIRTALMLGLVFIETAIIYALLVVILIIFVL